MNSPSTAERITITHYSSCNGWYEIDKAILPPFVSGEEFRGGAVTELEWQEFVHLVDSHLRPINRLRHILKIILLLKALVLLAFLIFIFFGYDQPTLQYFEDYPSYWLMPVFASLLAMAAFALFCYVTMATKRSFHSIKRLCEEQSKVLATATKANKSLLVSFHLCDERSVKGFNVHAHDMVYTGDEYLHQPFRTYHNVYILCVVTMVDPENSFGRTSEFRLPVKFPTIEFNSGTDDDDSTLGESTIYTSYTGGMTVTRDVLKSIQKKKATKQTHRQLLPAAAAADAKDGSREAVHGEVKANIKKMEAESDNQTKEPSKKKKKDKAVEMNGKKETRAEKGKKKKKKKSPAANQNHLDTITESS